MSEVTQTGSAAANGRNRFADRGFLWRRPRVWVGGEWANRLGLQPVRCMLERFSHRPNAKRAMPAMRELAQDLIDNGMIVIPDFLEPEQFERIRREFELSFGDHQANIETVDDNTVNKLSPTKLSTEDGVHTAVIRGVRQSSSRIREDRYPYTAEYLLRNPRILSVVSAALGRTVKYNPGAYFQREYRNPGAESDSEQNIVLHEDVHYTSFKAFYYINDNDADNGAFIAVPKSHLLNWKRLRHEYAYSVDIARQKNGKPVSHPQHESGRMEVYGQVYDKEELTEVQAIGKANTLVIANTMAFHRRGGSSDTERQQVRMCFRHAETLHHRLYPRFGTADSKRLREGLYF